MSKAICIHSTFTKLGSRIRPFNYWCQNQRVWMTLNGRYSLCCIFSALCCRKHASFGAHHKNWNEDRPILSAAHVGLVSGNIRFMRIFAGVLWRGGIKRQWGNRKHWFFMACGRYVFGTLQNEANIIIQYYLVPCRLSSDPKIYDLEWPWLAISR